MDSQAHLVLVIHNFVATLTVNHLVLLISLQDLNTNQGPKDASFVAKPLQTEGEMIMHRRLYTRERPNACLVTCLNK